MSVQQQVRALVERHLLSLEDKMTAIDGKLRDLANADAHHADRLGDLVALTHEVNGSSGSIGFRGISAAAAALEEHLRELAVARRTPGVPELAQVRTLFGELERLVGDTKPADSSIYHADFGQSERAAGA